MNDDKNSVGAEAKGQKVKSTTDGYNYKYSSLADLYDAGITIPKMRVKPVFSPNGEYVADYIEYWDGKDWQTGAKVVVPKMSGANDAQMYGSALTYSRRYAVMMAQSVVCEDDKKLESKPTTRNSNSDSHKPAGATSKNGLDFDAIKKEIRPITDTEALKVWWMTFMNNNHLTEKQQEAVNKIVNAHKNYITTGTIGGL